MTNTAAATRTPRTPRHRLHEPAAWERVGTVSGVLATTALVVAVSTTHRRLPPLSFPHKRMGDTAARCRTVPGPAGPTSRHWCARSWSATRADRGSDP
jgi:hypothetical protein